MTRRLILATDLDGTMAHGSSVARQAVVEAVKTAPDGRLIYVTGRTPASARELLTATALPVPDLLIADVGTSVLLGAGPERATAIESELDALWPGEAAIRERLAPLAERNPPSITPQQIESPRRVGYWIEAVRARREAATPAGHDPFAARAPDDPSLDEASRELATAVTHEVAARLESLEVDVVVSANVFLDILPEGVNKGSTLRRVLHWIGVDEEDCVVAGDSLNDVALFETGLRGIVVGNCEPLLLRRVRGLARVYRAQAAGAAGVLEGLRHHGYNAGGAPEGRDHGE